MIMETKRINIIYLCSLVSSHILASSAEQLCSKMWIVFTDSLLMLQKQFYMLN
jgi:hypothetical protein